MNIILKDFKQIHFKTLYCSSHDFMFKNKLFQMNFSTCNCFFSFTIYLTFLINAGQKGSFIKIETMQAMMLEKYLLYI